MARATAANRSRLSAASSNRVGAARPSIERHSSTEMGTAVHPALASPERVRALGVREAELKAEIQLLEAQVELAIKRSPRHHSHWSEGGPTPRTRRQAGWATSGQQPRGSPSAGSSERHTPRPNSASRMPPHAGGVPFSHVQQTVDERLQSTRKSQWQQQ